jgi:phage/plasmid-like protein (TIGR03299 family)
MTKLDVNEEFRATRILQIERAEDRHKALEEGVAKGELRKNTNGTYTVLSGMDAGEVLDGLGMPRHGLDLTETGNAKLYLKDTPAWHALGTVIKGGLSSADAVLRCAGLNWTTELRKVRYLPELIASPIEGAEAQEIGTFHTSEVDAGIFTVPDQYVTVRSDTLQAMGVVGKRYTPFHNADAYAFLDELFGDRLMICETAGSMNDGADVFISAELPDDLIIDPSGFADHIKQYVVIKNNHNGRSPIVAMTTPWRPVCANTERFAIRDAVSKWIVRHTKNAKTRMLEAQRTLGLTTQYYQKWAEEENALLGVPFSGQYIDALIREVWGELDSDATARARTAHNDRRDKVFELFAVESNRVGHNAYAAERAVTGYVDHHRVRRNGGKYTPLEALGIAIMEDTGTEDKTRAHKKLMELVKR